jgi:urease accessory protein
MRRWAALILLLAGLPSAAHAHLMTTGLGPFYDGLAHLFVTPEDLLPIIALSLLAGLRGPGFGRTVLFTLPLACLAGSLAGLLVTSPVAFPLVGAALTIALGAMVASDLSLPLAALAGIAIFLGLFSGGVSGIEMARTQGLGLSAIGAASAVFVLVAIIAGNIAALKAHWARIAVRIAGSWIAASGLLMLGWALRKG